MMERYKAIEAMNLLVLAMNDESAYEEWIIIAPDEATSDDFLAIAQDDELMNDATRTFIHIMNTYGKAGIYLGSTLFPM